ncbi:MAG: hypothetical protein BWY77_01590 [bacterium ADurb.Bin431]|nr:MAG: hypothetical protein BWY77_01590 [bacterium ADurb.Bin431]
MPAASPRRTKLPVASERTRRGRLKERSGMAMIRAFSTGRPVVSSLTTPEMLRGSGAGLLRAKSMPAAAEWPLIVTGVASRRMETLSYHCG